MRLAAGSVCIGNNRLELLSAIRSLVFVISLAIVVSISVILVAVPKSSDAEIRQKIADEETRVCDAQTAAKAAACSVLLCFVISATCDSMIAVACAAYFALVLPVSASNRLPAAAPLAHLCTVRTAGALADVQ